MIGSKYGKWKVLSEGKIEGNKHYYNVVCECGKISEVELNNLRYGRSTQCRACAGASRLGVSAELFKPGTLFGRWEIIREQELVDAKKRSYLCRCKCGVESVIPGYALKSGRSTQCKDCKLGKGL